MGAVKTWAEIEASGRKGTRGMSRYRKVDPRIWNDAKFMSLSDKGKLVFFFILTHPHMTAIGAMRASTAGLSAEMGWEVKAFREAFMEAFLNGMVEYDEKASMICLPNFLKYNSPESPNVVKAWANALDLLPECELLAGVLRRAINKLEGMGKAFLEALPEGFAKAIPKTMPYQEQEQEQEQDNKKLCAFAEQKTPGCGGEFYLTAKKKKLKGKTLESFNAFWRAFDYPKGKASAADAFLAVYTPENVGEIIAGATVEAMERPMVIAGGKTPKWAQGWLTGRRWEDLKEDAGQPPTIVLPEYVPPLKGGM